MPEFLSPNAGALPLDELNSNCENFTFEDFDLITDFATALTASGFRVANEVWSRGSQGQGALGLRLDSLNGQHSLSFIFTRLALELDTGRGKLYKVEGNYKNTSGLGSTQVPGKIFTTLREALNYLNVSSANAYGRGLALTEHVAPKGFLATTSSQVIAAAAFSAVIYLFGGEDGGGAVAHLLLFGGAFIALRLFASGVRAERPQR